MTKWNAAEYSAELAELVAKIEGLVLHPRVAARGNPLDSHLWMASAVTHELADYSWAKTGEVDFLRPVALRLGKRVTLEDPVKPAVLEQAEGPAAELEKVARDRGFDWEIEFSGEAFFLIRDAGKRVSPMQVLGRTEEQVRSTISLTAATAKAKRRTT
jgi:hypothetical protein